MTFPDIRLEGTVLKATCRRKDERTFFDSELDLNPLIGNIDGHFEWKKQNFVVRS